MNTEKASASGRRVMPNGSMRTVLVALGSGLAVAVAKAVVAVVTGSSAMAAEASHSLADTANELIHPSVTSSFTVAFVALAISTVFTQPLRSADEDR